MTTSITETSHAPVPPASPTAPPVAWLTEEQAGKLPPDVAGLVTARDGWTAEHWVSRLRFLADAYAERRPDLSGRYQTAADRMTKRDSGPESIGAIVRRWDAHRDRQGSTKP